MKIKSIFLILAIIAFSCKQESNPKPLPQKQAIKPKAASEKPEKEIRYPEKELLAFIDSVAKLPSGKLQEKVAFRADSIFKNRQAMNRKLSAADFKILRKSISEEWMSLKAAHRIFGEFKVNEHDTMDGKIPISLISFNKDKAFDEFAISFGPGALEWATNVYFFKSDKIISKHYIFHRYGLDLESYKDSDGKTIFYYKQNFQSGSGIWWFNYYFYKYDNNRIIPVLNELQNANMTWPGNRQLWLESTIIKTNPLTLKMVYRQEPYSPSNEPETSWIINDSTFVTYKWNHKTKMLEGDYARSKINKTQILTYYLEDNELLFINAYHKLLKKELQNAEHKEAILYYLFDIKHNHH